MEVQLPPLSKFNKLDQSLSFLSFCDTISLPIGGIWHKVLSKSIYWANEERKKTHNLLLCHCHKGQWLTFGDWEQSRHCGFQCCRQVIFRPLDFGCVERSTCATTVALSRFQILKAHLWVLDNSAPFLSRFRWLFLAPYPHH